MAKISSEELSRQLSISNKTTESIAPLASAIDVSQAQAEVGNVNIGGLKDQILNLVNTTSSGINLDLSAQLTDLLPGGLADVNSLFAGTAPQLHELGKLQILQDFGPPKGGIQPLVKTSYDLIDDVQQDLPDLLKSDNPALSKIDQSMAGEIPALKTEIPEADLANMEKLFTTPADAGGVDPSTMFAKATAVLQNASAITKEVYTDGSIEAIAEELKSQTGLDATQLKGTLEKFAGPNLTEELDDLLNKVTSGDLISGLTASIEKLNTVISGTVGNLTAGGLLRGLAEKVTNNIGAAITSLGLEDDNFNTFDIKNDVLSSNTDAAKDKLAAGVVPAAVIVNLIGYTVPFSSMRELINAVNRGKKSAVTTEEKAAVQELQNKGDAIAAIINTTLGSLNGSVTTQTNETPPNPNPVSDADKRPAADIITSKQELIKYFQAVNRGISSIRIYPISDFKDLDYSPTNSGGTGIVDGGNFYIKHSTKFSKMGPEGPAHLYVRSDGTIETMRDVNKPSITDLGGNEYVLDVCLHRYQDKNTATSKQVEAVMIKIVDAFISTFPLAQVYSGSVFNEDDRQNNFIGVDISSYYPRRETIHDPFGDDLKYLSKEELLALGKEEAAIAARERKDIQ